MKANAPEKIYLQPRTIERLPNQNVVYTKPLADNSIEYTRTDTFIEKAVQFLKDHLAGYDICEDDIERSVESFKLAMKL